MKIKTIIAATLLALTPTISLAMCDGDHVKQQASSCAEGMVWDAATATCIAQVSG